MRLVYLLSSVRLNESINITKAVEGEKMRFIDHQLIHNRFVTDFIEDTSLEEGVRGHGYLILRSKWCQKQHENELSNVNRVLLLIQVLKMIYNVISIYRHIWFLFRTSAFSKAHKQPDSMIP